jgi:hypothetical protein
MNFEPRTILLKEFHASTEYRAAKVTGDIERAHISWLTQELLKARALASLRNCTCAQVVEADDTVSVVVDKCCPIHGSCKKASNHKRRETGGKKEKRRPRL